MANDQTAAAVQAAMGQAKVAGLIVDKRRDETPTTENPEVIGRDISRLVSDLRKSGDPATLAVLDTLVPPATH